MDTYLIFKHRITNVLKQTPKLVRILDIAEETLDLPLCFQRDQTQTNVLQFPSDPTREY